MMLLVWALNLLLLATAAYGLRRALALEADWLRPWFWPVLTLKLLGGLALGWLYLYFYPQGGDTLTMQWEAQRVTDWIATPNGDFGQLLWPRQSGGAMLPIRYPAFSNSYFFVRLLALLNFLTHSNYWLNGLWLSVCAFGGSWLLTRELGRVVPGARYGIMLGALFWPSVILWMAGGYQRRAPAGQPQRADRGGPCGLFTRPKGQANGAGYYSWQ